MVTLPLTPARPSSVDLRMPLRRSMPTFPTLCLRLGILKATTHIVSSVHYPSKSTFTTNDELLACNTNVNVTVSFGGRTWAISSADFMMTRASGNRCIGSFFVLGTTTPPWIIGDTFLVRSCSPFIDDSTSSSSLSRKTSTLCSDIIRPRSVSQIPRKPLWL